MNSSSGRLLARVATRLNRAACCTPRATSRCTAQRMQDSPMKAPKVLPSPNQTLSGVSTKLPSAAKAITR